MKPALCAGFLLLGTNLPLFAQDYIDVEAERRADAENLNAPVPVSVTVDNDAASYSGIRPYSGSTTVASPPSDIDDEGMTGSDSGSPVLRVQQLEADVPHNLPAGVHLRKISLRARTSGLSPRTQRGSCCPRCCPLGTFQRWERTRPTSRSAPERPPPV